MTDWAKLKVTELKEECKARDIPLTGIKLKQQYIDKLEEYETNKVYQDTFNEERDQAGDDAQGEDQKQSSQPTNDEAPPEADKPAPPLKEHTQPTETHPDTEELEAAPVPVADKNDLHEASPPETATPNAQPNNERLPPVETRPEPPAPSTPESQPQHPTQHANDEESKADAVPTPISTTLPPSDTSTPASTQVPLAELVEDQRKRKRRSVTPAPDAQEVALKRARANDGTPMAREPESDALAQVQQATDASQALREADGLLKDGPEQTVKPLESTGFAELALDRPMEAATEAEAVPEPPAVDREPVREEAEDRRDRSPSAERSVAPALHSHTSSLYIRNFKRPLHIPTLKEHIIKLAKPRTDPDSDPVKTFYLDSIRTHAFISLSSIPAATRVRAEMHETRFPDEPQREPLFVDYLPDDKVQAFIDQETGGGFGRGGNNRRYEVVYNEGSNGVEAVLQDADTSRQKPNLPPPRNSISNAPKAPMASGVHPDRAPFVPREQRKPSHQELPPRPRAGETGFKALDELFSSTTSKPKLYYKPVAPEVVDDRLDMIKGLRVGHGDMGRSGDEGMKRYTFEKYKGREEWVDKGPEFGHGQRGQAILRGDRGRRRGGYRGGRGDSWRGR